jgi:hypothetical protein
MENQGPITVDGGDSPKLILPFGLFRFLASVLNGSDVLTPVFYSPTTPTSQPVNEGVRETRRGRHSYLVHSDHETPPTRPQCLKKLVPDPDDVDLILEERRRR